ncbi:hypothetical protein [Haloarchaeobius salinus]|uniref:hypothetical protein n=1 Tax=Haloarchaeobius salinus TaxID=1198298 RepID=UPI00210DA784|nr:hypothetical protein [Haloarchaeobius salinus]
MTVFRGGDAIRTFFEELDTWLSEPIEAYLLGGSAMTVHGLKDQTEDIDLGIGVVDEFEHVSQTLQSQRCKEEAHGFSRGRNPTRLE